MKLLIIEDDLLMMRALELKLKKEGYETIACADGKEGIRRIAEMRPDLVITDLMLPLADGIEILKYVKSLQGDPIPVLILSALGQEGKIEEAFKYGVDDYITKPFSLVELAIRIKKLVK